MERRIPKPGEKNEYVVKLEKQPYYPYLDLTSYSFLKSAIEEGAYKKRPRKLNKFSNAEERWVSIRNVAFTYLSSKANHQQLADMYGVSKTQVRRYIRDFEDTVWNNSSDYLKSRYPRQILSFRKPDTQEHINNRSNSAGGRRGELIDLIRSGKKFSEILDETGVRSAQLRRAYKSIGLNPRIVMGGALLREELELINFGENSARNVPNLLKNVTEGFLADNPDLFVTRSQFFKEAGLPLRNSAKVFNRFMELKGIPIGKIKTGERSNIMFILRSDFDRLFEHVTREVRTDSRVLKGPSETPDPTF